MESFKRQSVKEKIIALRKKNSTITAADMARQLEVSRQAIGDHLKRLGLPTKFHIPSVCKKCDIKVRYGANQCTDCRRASLRMAVACGTCGKEKMILKSELHYRLRSKKYAGKTWYCNKPCFYGRHQSS